MAEVEEKARREGRVLAMDFGKKRIGLAVSDPLGVTAQGLETLERTRIRDDLQALSRVVRDYDVRLIVAGLPLHMSGAESRQGQFTREFSERLQRETGVPVRYWDERWTSVQAGRVLRESGVGREKRAAAIDRLSAVILLESYLDSVRANPEPD
jgi:putative Holliday junction resolvase